jgi:hypothetical protein
MERMRSIDVAHVKEHTMLQPLVELRPVQDDEPTTRRTFDDETEVSTVVAVPSAAILRRAALDDRSGEFDDLARTSVMATELVQALAERTRHDDAAAPAPQPAETPTPAASATDPSPPTGVQPASPRAGGITRARVVLSAAALLATSLGALGLHQLHRPARALGRAPAVDSATAPAVAPVTADRFVSSEWTGDEPSPKTATTPVSDDATNGVLPVEPAQGMRIRSMPSKRSATSAR